MTIICKSHSLIKTISNSFIDLPAPLNISSWWNFGSLLGICLILQIHLYVTYNNHLLLRNPHLLKHELQMNYSVYTHQRSVYSLDLLIHSSRTRPVLWILYLPRKMRYWHLIHSNSCSIYRLDSSMRSSAEQQFSGISHPFSTLALV